MLQRYFYYILDFFMFDNYTLNILKELNQFATFKVIIVQPYIEFNSILTPIRKAHVIVRS